MKKYKLIVKYLDDKADFTDEQQAQRGALRLAGHLNCALCHLKLGSWSEAKEQCNSALEFDNNSEKALFRRAQVLYCTRKFWFGVVLSHISTILVMSSANE